MAADGPCWPELHKLQVTTDRVMLFGLKRIVASVSSQFQLVQAQIGGAVMRGGPIFFDQFEMIAEGVLEQNRLRLGAQSLTQPRAVEFHRLFLSQSPVNPVETVAGDFNANNRRAMQFFVFRQGLAAKKNTDAAARHIQKRQRKRGGTYVDDAQAAPLIDRHFQHAGVKILGFDEIVDRIGNMIEENRGFRRDRISSSMEQHNRAKPLVQGALYGQLLDLLSGDLFA
jgi:hypothetical protein